MLLTSGVAVWQPLPVTYSQEDLRALRDRVVLGGAAGASWGFLGYWTPIAAGGVAAAALAPSGVERYAVLVFALLVASFIASAIAPHRYPLLVTAAALVTAHLGAERGFLVAFAVVVGLSVLATHPRSSLAAAIDRSVACVPYAAVGMVGLLGADNARLSVAPIALALLAVAIVAFVSPRRAVPPVLLRTAPFAPLVLTLAISKGGTSAAQSAYLMSSMAVVLTLVLAHLSLRVVRRVVRDDLATELDDGVRHLYAGVHDVLHQQVLNRLAAAEALLEVGARKEALEQIRSVGDFVRRFRATEIVEPEERVENVIDAAGRRYRHLVTVSFDPDPSDVAMPVLVDDARHLAWVLEELVSNAAKHCRRNGPTAKMEIHVARLDGALEVTLADDGPGIESIGTGTLARVLRVTSERPRWKISHELGTSRFTVTIPEDTCDVR